MADSSTETRTHLLQRLQKMALGARKVPFEMDSSLPEDPDEALNEIQRRTNEDVKKLRITPIEDGDWENDLLE